MLKGGGKTAYGSLANRIHVYFFFFPYGSVKGNCYSFEISVLEGFHLSL